MRSSGNKAICPDFDYWERQLAELWLARGLLKILRSAEGIPSINWKLRRKGYRILTISAFTYQNWSTFYKYSKDEFSNWCIAPNKYIKIDVKKQYFQWNICIMFLEIYGLASTKNSFKQGHCHRFHIKSFTSITNNLKSQCP